MPDSVFAYVSSCPANTPAGAPVEFVLAGMDPIIPRKVTITIPDGHAGLTGIAVAFGHNAVLPSNTGGYISGNDYTFPFDLTNYPAGVSWSVLMCNTDTIAHVWQILFEGDNLAAPPAPAVSPPLSTGELAAAQEAALAGP